MRKIYRDRLYLSIFTFVLLFITSCNSEDILQEEGESSSIELRSAADGKYDLLGYGYDVTDDYLGLNSHKRKILDIDAIRAIKSDYYDFDNGSEISQTTYAGENSNSFLEEIKKKTNISANASFKPDNSNLNKAFTGSVSKYKETGSTFDYSSKYSFTRIDVMKRMKRHMLYGNTEVYKKCLSQTFLEDLNTFTPERLVKEYGTHVLTDITLGGMYSLTYRSVIEDIKNKNNKKTIVKAGAGIALKKIGLNIDGSIETEENTTLGKINKSWSAKLICKGGDGSGTVRTFSSDGSFTDTYNFDGWAKSVTLTNCRLVDVNWEKAIPIYELVADPIKKQQIKTVVDNYILNSQINMPSVAPLYVYYNPKTNAYVTTPNDNMWQYDSSYELRGITGYCLTSKTPQTTELYEYFESTTGYHTVTTNGDLAKNNKNQKLLAILGYIFYRDYFEVTSVPLYEYHSTKKGDHFAGSDNSLLKMPSNYERFNWELGFVLPTK